MLYHGVWGVWGCVRVLGIKLRPCQVSVPPLSHITNLSMVG